MDSSAIYAHSRSRTTSSNTFPLPIQQPAPMHLQQPPHPYQHSRRTPSVNTFSTASSIPPPAAYRTSPPSDLRRSTSSRSGGSQQQPASGYVALLRKQKATVWCDRSQYEDPRILAAQRAAKMRATMEVSSGAQRSSSGGHGSGNARTATGISTTGKVAAKIRHHGKPAVVGYAPGDNYVGVGGVPMRLSATEVEGESSGDEEVNRTHHRRTGSSGRSSTASKRGLGYRTSGGGGQRWSPGDTPERNSIVEDPKQEIIQDVLPDAASGRAKSFASGSSAERADNLGELNSESNAARLASRSLMHSALTREKSTKTAEDLKRRGSVDERTTSLTTTGRLFIANPD